MLFFMSFEVVYKKSCSITFPVTEVQLTSLSPSPLPSAESFLLYTKHISHFPLTLKSNKIIAVVVTTKSLSVLTYIF